MNQMLVFYAARPGTKLLPEDFQSHIRSPAGRDAAVVGSRIPKFRGAQSACSAGLNPAETAGRFRV